MLIRLFQQAARGWEGASPAFPKTLREFQTKLASEEAYQKYLSGRVPGRMVSSVFNAGTAVLMNWWDDDAGNVLPVEALPNPPFDRIRVAPKIGAHL